MTHHPGWFLVIVGALIAGMGLVWLLASSVPWLGKLPGDVSVEGENFSFYFPIVTCIILSVLLSAVVWLIRYLLR